MSDPSPARPWNRPEDVLPPEGLVVDAIAPSGNQQPLRRKGRLWFLPDGSMYVYYTPQFWRERDGQ